MNVQRRIQTLPGGIDLISIVRPASPTVALRLYVRAGSRYDAEQQGAAAPFGLAHLAEHLVFQGSGRRPRQEVMAAIERQGGVLEAGTTKEYSHYTVVTVPDQLAPALRVLADLLTGWSLDDDALGPEKLTVAQELARHQDQYAVLFDHFATALWKTHPLRHPILGTEAGLAQITGKTIRDFMSTRYVTGNMVLVACGAFDPADAEALAASCFGAVPAGPKQLPRPVNERPLETARCNHIERYTRQAYLMVGVPTVSMKHPDRSPLKVIERILGMGASARLYRRLRQQERLVYDVRTITAQYEDAGYFGVVTSCAPDNVAAVRAAILAEWDRLRGALVTADELAAAQSNYAGTLARRFETNLARAGITGVEYLLHRPEAMAVAIERIHSVQREDVLLAAQSYLDCKRYVAVSMGPFENNHE